MVIAVTGSNGHVGVNLCSALVQAGHEVRAFTHEHSQGLKGIPVNKVKGDLLEPASLKPLVEDAEVVFHLAARISIRGDKNGFVERVNTQGTRNMLEAVKQFRCRRFIHFSSIHAISTHPALQVLDETRVLVDGDGFAYDRSKAQGERLVLKAAQEGLDAVVLSPTAIMGPMDPEPSLAGQAVLDICNNRIPALVPGGYDWVDVRDIVKTAINAIDLGVSGEKYILSGRWYSLKELATLVAEVSGRKTVSVELPLWMARAGLPFIHAYSLLTRQKPLYTSESLTIITEGSRMISNQKARTAFGFSPRPLSDTLNDLVQWFIETRKL